jgi:hypothetical protein
MNHSTPPDCEPNSTSTLPEQTGVLVLRKHHFLVRWSHWLKLPILTWPHSEWHLYLLGLADLSAQARSEYGTEFESVRRRLAEWITGSEVILKFALMLGNAPMANSLKSQNYATFSGVRSSIFE